MSTTTNNCNPYIFHTFDLIIPPLTLFYNLCSSYDKTQLFITSCIRLIISIIITFYIEQYVPTVVLYGLYIWIVINTVSLSIILSKIPHWQSTQSLPYLEPDISHQYYYDDPITSDEII